MDAYYPWDGCSAREWLLRLARLGQGCDQWAALESALSRWERYAAERDVAGRISEERSKLLAEPSLSNQEQLAASLEENWQELFRALARQIIAQEKLRVAVEACRDTYVIETLPFEAEMFVLWLESQAATAREETRMHQLLIDRGKPA